MLVITGDGELLMGLGALATIGVQRPGNLALVVLDNERYGETGGQATHTAHGVDLVAIAAAAGFQGSRELRATADVDEGMALALHGAGPVLLCAKVRPTAAPMVVPPRDGALLARRFRAAVAAAVRQSKRRPKR